MSFFSSLRPSRAIARSGILLSTLLALGSLVVPASAQMGGFMTSGYDADSPYGSGAQQAQKGLLNIPSGIQRPGNYSSNNAVKALLYQDASSVLHVCLNKIDYESLSSFVNEIVDKGAGSVRSDDKYRVQLREFQKTDLQNSFQSLLSSLQSTITQSTFKKNIDEFYCVKYVSSDPKKMGCVILAIPTAGLSDAQVCGVMDFLGEQNYVLTIFKRYGFVIAVVSHDSAIPLDLDEIDAKYQERMEKSVEAEYGSYSTGSSSDSSNSQKNSFSAISQDYLNEVKAAQESNKAASRKEVLPRVRNRFSSPATEDEAKALSEGLQLGEGCAVTICVKNLDSIKDLLASSASSEASTDLPFAGLGSASDDSSADKSAVDLRHSHKFGSVLRIHAAAVLNTDGVCARSAVEFSYDFTDNLYRVVSVLSGSGFARSDRPYGFVSDNDVLELLFGDIFERADRLSRNHFGGLSAFSFFEKFAYAYDNFESCVKRGFGSEIDGFVGFSEILSSFAVSGDNVTYSQFFEHLRADFSGERAFFRPMYVLRADFYVRTSPS